MDNPKLSPKGSYPEYGVTSSLLKMLPEYIWDTLCTLCYKSLQKGICPSKLKIANILPLSKAGDQYKFLQLYARIFIMYGV